MLPKNVPDQPLYFKLVGYLNLDDKKVVLTKPQYGLMTLVNLYPTVPATAIWCLAWGDDDTYWVFNIHRMMRTQADRFYLDKSSLKFTNYNAALTALQMEGV